MRCPICANDDSRVIDSRETDDGNSVRRRRECLACGGRFSTFERAELHLPPVRKSDGRREPFSGSKLRGGMQRALEKRPVSVEDFDTAYNGILRQVRAAGDSEITSDAIGEIVMGALRRLDDVAYVRFASVYKDFQDPKEFSEEVARLRRESRTPASRRDK